MRKLAYWILLFSASLMTLSCGKDDEDFSNERLEVISETPQLPRNDMGNRLFPKEGGTVEIVFELTFDGATIGAAVNGTNPRRYINIKVDNGTVSYSNSIDDDASGLPRTLKAGRHTLVVRTEPIPESAFNAGEVGCDFLVEFTKEHYDKYGNLIDITGGGFGFSQPVSY